MYAFVILILIGFLPQMIDGPFTKPVLKVTDTCNQYWWANLLYINNFVPNNHDKMVNMKEKSNGIIVVMEGCSACT